MALAVVPLHHNKKYMSDCCKLINEEWKRSEAARMHGLESSSDTLPTSLILLQDENVLGHLKLTAIPSIPEACFVESVVIQKELRGHGLGTILMKEAEQYCRLFLRLKQMYLSTKGQEAFYNKLGYVECKPISIYGNYSYSISSSLIDKNQNYTGAKDLPSEQTGLVPMAPPLPTYTTEKKTKTYMMKNIQ